MTSVAEAAETAAVAPAAGRARECGGARRERLLGVTIELIAREGFDAVTHRRVAEPAAVLPSFTTYYFASREEMLVSQRPIARCRARRLDGPGDRVVSAERDVSGPGSGAHSAALSPAARWPWGSDVRAAIVHGMDTVLRVRGGTGRAGLADRFGVFGADR